MKATQQISQELQESPISINRGMGIFPKLKLAEEPNIKRSVIMSSSEAQQSKLKSKFINNNTRNSGVSKLNSDLEGI